jgi:RNA polymerase sigma-70 factor (ECF subfamily)
MRVTGKLQTQFTDKIQVLIYPDIKSFHAAIFMPEAPDWVVAAAGKNELLMVSPLNPGDEHNYVSLIKAIVHELIHTAVLNLREQGLAGLPKWLNEGYAYYEANQMTDNWRESIKANFTKETLPSWTQLDNANTVEFGDMQGYGLSTTIIEFLVITYGFNKLRQLILSPQKIASIYGFSSADLEKQWTQYLKAN